MNWKNTAIEDLNNYYALKMSITNITEEIGRLEQLRKSTASSLHNQYTGNVQDNRDNDHIINNIVKMERLKLNLKSTKTIVERIERSLTTLNDIERQIVTYRYIEHKKLSIEELRHKTGYERAHLFRIINQSLYKFTRAMYGIVDL